MIIELYHGTDKVFDKFKLTKVVDYTGGGFGLYFSESKNDALKYGNILLTCKINLRKQLYLNKRSLTKQKVREFLNIFEKNSPTSYIENFADEGRKTPLENTIDALFEYKNSDVDIYSDVINATNQPLIVMSTLVKMGYNYTIDMETSNVLNYIIFNPNDIKIVSREKILFESITFEDLTTNNMLFQNRAKSKSQRRLMAMALAHKRGELPKKYINDTIEQLSDSISEETLQDFAKTKQKKRKKDGSIGKRNNIPQKVEK